MSKGLGRALTALALVMALAMVGSAFADGQPKESAPVAPIKPTAIDFSNGNQAFLRLDRARRGASMDFTLEPAEFNGQPAVKVASQGAKTPYIGVSVSSLLSAEDLPRVATVVVKAGLESATGEFWPMTGTVYAYTGSDPAALEESTGKFGIQTPESNPKDMYVRIAKPFSAGASNYLLIQPSQDDGTSYTGKSDLYILGLTFLDAEGAALPVNPDAGEDFPAGYDEVPEDAPTDEYELGFAPYKSDWNNFNSNDVPLEVWNSATALIVEFTPRDDGSSPIETNPGGSKFVIQVVGGPAEQGWREVTLDDPLVEIDPGKSVKLYLDDMDQVTEVQNVGIGCWDGADTITRIALALSK
ncbi:MAG: hypothetical protein LBS11_02445 [Oscillospiraceae bacterium]|jgi:hypothetical protein|nr:hypothetical protein [Oscillospiraceae bacterium]